MFGLEILLITAVTAAIIWLHIQLRNQSRAIVSTFKVVSDWVTLVEARVTSLETPVKTTAPRKMTAKEAK
jgi:hypothetical protein